MEEHSLKRETEKAIEKKHLEVERIKRKIGRQKERVRGSEKNDRKERANIQENMT